MFIIRCITGSPIILARSTHMNITADRAGIMGHPLIYKIVKQILDVGHLLEGPVDVVGDGLDLELLVDQLVLNLVDPGQENKWN